MSSVESKDPSSVYSSLYQSPPEVLTKILRNLNLQELFFTALTCKKFWKIARHREMSVIRSLKKIRHVNPIIFPLCELGTTREVLVSKIAMVIIDRGFSSDSITVISRNKKKTKLMQPDKRVHQAFLLAERFLIVIKEEGSFNVKDLEKKITRVEKGKIGDMITPNDPVICVTNALSTQLIFAQNSSESVFLLRVAQSEFSILQLTKPANSEVRDIDVDDQSLTFLATRTLKKPWIKRIARKQKYVQVTEALSYDLENKTTKMFPLPDTTAKRVLTSDSWIAVETSNKFVLSNRSFKEKINIPFLSDDEKKDFNETEIQQFKLSDHFLVAVRGKEKMELVAWNLGGDRLSTSPLDSFQQMDIKWNIAAVLINDKLIEFWKITDGKKIDSLKLEELPTLKQIDGPEGESIEDQEPEKFILVKFLENNQLSVQTTKQALFWDCTRKNSLNGVSKVSP